MKNVEAKIHLDSKRAIRIDMETGKFGEPLLVME